MSKHDKFFRAVFSRPDVLHALLLERSPISLARALLGPPRPLSEHFVDERLREHIADIVMLLELRGAERVIAACVVEHASAPRADFPIQVLRYQAQLYERLASQFPPGKVPPIVVVVVTNGRRRWRGVTRFSELLSRHRATRTLALDFEMIVIDITALDDETVSPNPVLAGALLALKAATATARQRRRLVEAALQRLAREPKTLAQAARYLAELAPSQVKSTLKKLSKDGDETMETYASYYERRGKNKGLKEGLEKGLEKGREQGRRKGLEEGLRQSLSQVLTKRFKRVPPALAKRLHDASRSDLERWLDAALEAKSIKKVFEADA